MEKRKKFKRVVPTEIKVEQLTIDDIVCGTTKCEDGFHCYSQRKSSLRKFKQERACKECGVDLVDWARVHKNDIKDLDFVFEKMQTEIIRHVFWHTPIEDEAIYNLHIRGRIRTMEVAKKLLKTRIGKYNSFMDGRQTPMGKDEIINYAQHATATCCRKCLEAWHNIKLEAPLTDRQLDFCTDLVMRYIDIRSKNLDENPIENDEILKQKMYDYH